MDELRLLAAVASVPISKLTAGEVSRNAPGSILVFTNDENSSEKVRLCAFWGDAVWGDAVGFLGLFRETLKFRCSKTKTRPLMP